MVKAPLTAAFVAIIPLTSAFTISHFSSRIIPNQHQQLGWPLSASGKGFGDKTTTTKQTSEKQSQSSLPSPQSSTSVETTVATSSYGDETTKDASGTITENTGSQLLRELRSKEAEKKDAELRKIIELRETDALLQEEGASASAIPERVAQRMGKRMLPFVGIPLFGSFASFIGKYIYKYMICIHNLQ